MSGWGHLIASFFASVGLVNLLWPLIFSFPCHHDLRSLDVKYCQIRSRVAYIFKRSFRLQFSTSLWSSFWSWFTIIMFLCLVSMMWETLWPTFNQVTSFRLQLFIQEVDPKTPFRYPGACMPQWQVIRIRQQVHIIGLWLSDSASVWRHITVHIPWIVPVVPWDPLFLLVVSLVPIHNFHYWLVIKWFSCMFDFSSYIRMLEFVLVQVEMECKTLDFVW